MIKAPPAAVGRGTRLLSEDECRALFLSYRGGDEQALLLLHKKLSPVFYAYLSFFLDREYARDVLQEIWIRFLRFKNRFDETRSFLPWAWKIVQNEKNRFQRKKTFWLPLSYIKYKPRVETENWDVKILLDEVTRAAKSLSPEKREAFLLVRLGSLSYDEAAKIQNVPVGTIKSRLHQATKELLGIIGPPFL